MDKIDSALRSCSANGSAAREGEIRTFVLELIIIMLLFKVLNVHANRAAATGQHGVSFTST